MGPCSRDSYDTNNTASPEVISATAESSDHWSNYRRLRPERGHNEGIGRPRRAGYARCSDAVPFHPLAVTISRSTATAVRPLWAGQSAARLCVGD